MLGLETVVLESRLGHHNGVHPSSLSSLFSAPFIVSVKQVIVVFCFCLIEE